MVRVAALQFASATDVSENQQTCLRMIDQAAAQRPDLMVLPEFCNHISWYDDAAHAWEVALELSGDFLQAIADRARQHQAYIVINVSLRRSPDNITVSSLLYSPQGELLEVADKQTLMGHENDFFCPAQHTSAVVDTAIGRLAIFPCRDGVTFETPRGLALRGAQLFCDSLNSFALDEASLHVPARGPENKVFVVAANKVGPLIPESLLDDVSATSHIPVEFLVGAGESQVVAPDGRILAKGPKTGEAVVVAKVDLTEADDKLRPDGSDIFARRRPELYSALMDEPQGAYTGRAIAEIRAALYCPPRCDHGAIVAVTDAIAVLADDVCLLILPELFCIDDTELTDFSVALAHCAEAISAIASACANKNLQVCTSLVLESGQGPQLAAVLIDGEGMVASQPLLHASKRHHWSCLGDELQVFDLGWGKMAMLCGDDATLPEIVKVTALKGIHLLLLPLSIQEHWEADFGLSSRAAENRICLAACSRESAAGTGLIASLERDFTLMTAWQQRRFDGNINQPIITRQGSSGELTIATLHPDAASNKLMSANTELLQNRPWQLCGDLVKEQY